MIAAVLPVKPFDRAKSRLAEALGRTERAALAEAMCADVIAALGASRRIELLIAVSDEPAVPRLLEVLDGGLATELLPDPELATHSKAAASGIELAVERGAAGVALVPGDCPLLDAGELDRALARLGGEPFAGVVPDHHGTGTNALLLTPPGAIEPAFGPGSHDRHLARAREAGLPHASMPIPGLGPDADGPGDLARIRAELESRPEAVAPRTRAALRGLGTAAG